MKKRKHGEGTIYQRQDGRWCGQITIGIDPISGCAARRTIYGDSRDEVEVMLESLINLHRQKREEYWAKQNAMGANHDIENGKTKLAYSIQTLSSITGLSVKRIYDLIKDGEVPSVKLGNEILIPGWFVRKLQTELEKRVAMKPAKPKPKTKPKHPARLNDDDLVIKELIETNPEEEVFEDEEEKQVVYLRLGIGKRKPLTFRGIGEKLGMPGRKANKIYENAIEKALG